MGLENVNPHEELKRLEEQIKAATELAALKPIYFRLSAIIEAFPGDFDVWFTANEVKQHLVARGTLLQQGATSPPAPPAPPPSPPAMPPPPLPTSLLDTVSPAWGAPPEPSVMPAAAPLPQSSSLFDFAGPEQPPPALAGTSENPPPAPLIPPPAPRPMPPRPGGKPASTRKRSPALAIGLIAGLLAALVIIFFVTHQPPKRAANSAVRTGTTPVQVDIATAPPGASVRVAAGQSGSGGAAASPETTCTSNCKVALAPGTYLVSAILDGYAAAAESVTVTAQHPATVNLTLQPQAQSARLLTDLAQGKALVDDQPPADLQDGQLVLDKLAPGTHSVKITGPNGDASFSFEIANARLPAVTGPVSARNMMAVLVASFGKQARVVTNAGPWKLAVNGQPQGEASPAGTDLTSFQPGVNEIVVGEGKDQRTISENFDAAPMLTAFLKTDVNAGTLIVSAGQDGVRVFLNDKEYRRLTQRGQVRLQTLGKVTVRVAKSGFQDAPAQTVEVKKGAEVRLQFDLKPQPQFGSLGVHGAAPGTEVLVDQKSAGMVGPDGSLSFGSIPPGDHTVELRREQYLPKRIQRSFVAGREVELGGAEVVLAAANGAIRLTRNPASATVTYRRGDEAESHEASGNQIELPPGSYTFSAIAPGFTESTARVQLAAGENREVDFTLARERPVPAPPPVVVERGMADFEDAQGWKRDGGNWVHKGGGFVLYKLPSKGVFTFTVQLLKGGGVFRAGAIRWCVQYLDAKNYLLTEMDRKNFWTGVIKKGEKLERVKAPTNLGNQKAFTIRIEVTPDRLVQSVLVGNEWKVLDTFAEPGRDFTQGKFGFLIQGNDEIAISDFKFLPK